MNNLAYTTCYLVGAVDMAPDLGVGWREDITPFLKGMRINVINPMKKPLTDGCEVDRRAERSLLKSQGRFDEFSQIMKRVRAVDLRFVDKSDFIIVNFDLEIPACGTFEEIDLANRQRKPVLIRGKQGKKLLPDWMFGQLPHELFFSTWDELKKYLYNLDRCPKPDTVKDRWLFFDKRENL